MSFLLPALFGVLIPLAALPLVIHLLNKRFPKRFQFPSIQLIKETKAQRSRIYRWRHWILLLLRTAFLLLLLLAFLLPVLKRFGSNPAASGARDVLIVLDHSVSMEHKGGGPTARERAVHEAGRLIDSLGAADSVNVLLMQPGPATAFLAFTKDHAEAKRFLGRLKPGFGRADVNGANALAARLLNASEKPEVYFISDFQRKNWANANFTALPPTTKLFFVDVGAANRDNRAVLSARISQSHILAGDTVPLEISVGNFSAESFDGRVTVTLDQRFTFDQEISVAPWSEGKVIVPVAPGAPGLHLCEVRLPSDALEHDNKFFLTVAVQEKSEVLIVSDGANDAKSGAYFLKMALNPFDNEAGSLLPRVIPSAELSGPRVAGVRTIFFSGINRLTDDACRVIEKFLLDGGGLIYFLDGAADADNLASLEKVLGPNTMPMRLSQRHTASNVASGAQQVVRGDFKSPYLKLFQGATRQDLALLEFYDYYQAGTTGAGGVLLVYGDQSPAMASVHHGLGAMLLLNFSASEFSSNLARQRIFPAWMQELVKATSTAEPPPAAFTIGETVQFELWRHELKSDLLNPAGAPVNVRRELTGDRYELTFLPDQPGFYTLGSPRPLFACGINTSPDEADLRPIDKSVLPTEFAADREAFFVAGGDDYDELAKGRFVFHWFLFAALGLLLLESVFQFLIRRKTA